jgi:hypothetical protein
MSQFGGKDSKRHFTVVMGGKEHGLYVSSTPSSAAKKAVTKLCAANKSKKVEFHIREITQGSKKKTYGPYSGHIEKLKEPIKLKSYVIEHKPIAKLSSKSGAKKGGMRGGAYEFIMYEVGTENNGYINNRGMIIEDIRGGKKYFFKNVNKGMAKHFYFMATKKDFSGISQSFIVEDEFYSDMIIGLKKNASEIISKLENNA